MVSLVRTRSVNSYVIDFAESIFQSHLLFSNQRRHVTTMRAKSGNVGFSTSLGTRQPTSDAKCETNAFAQSPKVRSTEIEEGVPPEIGGLSGGYPIPNMWPQGKISTFGASRHSFPEVVQVNCRPSTWHRLDSGMARNTSSMVCSNEHISRKSQDQNMVAYLLSELLEVGTTYRHSAARTLDSTNFTVVSSWKTSDGSTTFSLGVEA